MAGHNDNDHYFVSIENMENSEGPGESPERGSLPVARVLTMDERRLSLGALGSRGDRVLTGGVTEVVLASLLFFHE
ncbi:MAG: hypothetical protein AVDCRST_MAG28-1208 [uncultured Rubrobacteraceae bacterium]|uniref:Uncharacterized protein n=1 Tax=uncultured Rubrobacteraceae bacterium TaxID=349277 RepID=A0A6J4QQX6_9ACTN|nr:MAG: hypothetical protein AVDCRST_MAG28-1208 [uncultured Rubrobacteraceae bacterium]